jgi:hypothetical protein
VTVHVWGPPEEMLVGFDERTCVEPDQGEETIFHLEPKEFADGSRMCLCCGSIFWRKGKGQCDRGKPV